MRALRERPFECPECGWQGMQMPAEVNLCPECSTPLERRPWRDTWGLTLLILGIVAAAVLFVAYFRRTG